VPNRHVGVRIRHWCDRELQAETQPKRFVDAVPPETAKRREVCLGNAASPREAVIGPLAHLRRSGVS